VYSVVLDQNPLYNGYNTKETCAKKCTNDLQKKTHKRHAVNFSRDISTQDFSEILILLQKILPNLKGENFTMAKTQRKTQKSTNENIQKKISHTKEDSMQEELLEKIRTAQIKLEFNSMGMTPLQVMVYLFQQAQIVIMDKLGIDALQLCLAEVIRDKLNNKTPLDAINEIKNYFILIDKAKIYSGLNHHSTYTVQELIDDLSGLDPTSPVVLGNSNIGVRFTSGIEVHYMLKDGSSDRLVMEGDFLADLEDKLEAVAVLEADIPRQKLMQIRTTPYSMCYSKQGNKKEIIKWMFEETQKVVKDYGIDLSFQLENTLDGDFDKALEIFDTHVEWVEVQ